MLHTSRPARLRAVFLDFDGVVADSMPGQEDAWRAAVRSVPGAGSYEALFVENLYSGNAGPRMFEGMQLDPDVRARLRSEKDRIWFAERNAVPLVPSAGAEIRRLSGKLILGIATSGARPYVESVLAREGLLGRFGCILTDADVTRPKPNPDLVETLLQVLEVNPAQAVMVGDSRTDLEMATAAGVPFIGYGAAEWPQGVTCVRDWETLGHELRQRADS